MTKTLSLTAISLTAALMAIAAATAPSQAATRLMSSSLEGFQYRCENHGGIFDLDGALASCDTPSVPVVCEYFDDNQAMCDWPGIERQIAVVQVIGTLPEVVDETGSDDGSSEDADGAKQAGGSAEDDGHHGGNFLDPDDHKVPVM
jgi:hypothetical protein